MKTIYYNPVNENGGCVIRSISKALNKNYLDVKNELIHINESYNEEEVFEMINYIKQYNCKVGISVKPNTKIEEVYKYLPYIHMCLVMTVEPGKGGQSYLSEMTEKVRTLKSYIDDNHLEVDIEVDGGINLRTAPEVKKAGANILVAGTAILNAVDYKVIIDELKCPIGDVSV